MENYLKLTLTDLGQKTMLRLMNTGKKPTLTIGISHSTDKFLGNEPDLLSKFQILPDAKMTLQDDETKLHIQASLANASSDYDIYQIGLFLDTIPEESGKLILFANYHSTELLAKKLAKQDMVLDIIVCLETFKTNDFTIEIKDVLPMFTMPAATHERHGSVRLATIQDIEIPPKSNEGVLSTALLADSTAIADRKPGFILTTNHLDSLLPSPRTAQTFKPISIYQGTAGIQETAETILAFSSYCDDSFIYHFIAIKNTRGDNKLFLSRYEFKTKAIKDSSEIQEVSDLFEGGNVLQANGLMASYNEAGGINYYFFTKKNNKNILRKLSIQVRDKALVNELSNGEPNLITVGQSFLYNQTLANLAARSEEVLINFFNEKLSRIQGALRLPYKGTDAFAYVIQDQVICLTITEERTVLSPRVAIYKFSDSTPTYTSLPPPPSATLDFKPLAANSKLLSCSLDFCIYFFSLELQVNTVLKSEYYQYDVVNNHWTKRQFQAGNPVTVSGQFQQASLAKWGKHIYLCVAYLDEAKSIVLSIIKLTGEDTKP
jgi:hypothetical protein